MDRHGYCRQALDKLEEEDFYYPKQKPIQSKEQFCT